MKRAVGRTTARPGIFSGRGGRVPSDRAATGSPQCSCTEDDMRESEQKLGNGLHHRILEYFNQGWVIEDGWRVLALGSYPQTTRVKNIYTGEIFEVGLMIAPAEPIP